MITHKKAIAISISKDTCLRAKENIEAAINKREYKTITAADRDIAAITFFVSITF